MKGSINTRDMVKEERKITSMKELQNIYDKGFQGNLKEVFFPPKF